MLRLMPVRCAACENGNGYDAANKRGTCSITVVLGAGGTDETGSQWTIVNR